MDRFQYLLDCKFDSPDDHISEILNTWHYSGAIVVDKDTKVYQKDTIVRVDAAGPLHNSIIYVLESYFCDNKVNFPIDWSILSPDDITGLHAALEGIQLPYFGILKAKYDVTFIPDPNFVPYQNPELIVDSGGVNISDEELQTILTPLGFPFVTFDDIEYSKSQICKYMIKPALQRYYSYRPIIDEQPGTITATSVGGRFAVPFPEGAFACIPYYTVPGGASAQAASSNPFSFYNEMMMTGQMGGGGRFGRGIRYHGKQVPGFVGLESRNTQIDTMLANQGFLNFFRRERYTRVKDEKGKYWATGFSTVGGNLNFVWLKASNDWGDVRWEDLENIARPMARIEVLRNFATLRGLVKQDIPGKLDETKLEQRADKIEEALDPIIKSIGMTGLYAVMRGGGN